VGRSATLIEVRIEQQGNVMMMWTYRMKKLSNDLIGDEVGFRDANKKAELPSRAIAGSKMLVSVAKRACFEIQYACAQAAAAPCYRPSSSYSYVAQINRHAFGVVVP